MNPLRIVMTLCVCMVMAPTGYALDGYALAYLGSEGGPGELILIDASDSSKRDTIDDGRVQTGCFSRDGQKIAYAMDNGMVYVINSDQSGSAIAHDVNHNGDNLMFVERNGETYLYWAGRNSGLMRVKLGSDNAEAVPNITGSPEGQVSHDGSRAGVRWGSGDVKCVDLDNGEQISISRGFTCMPSLSVDGEWVAHNTYGHTEVNIFQWWSSDIDHTITNSGGISNLRFCRTSPEYMVATGGDSGPVLVIHHPDNIVHELGKGIGVDYYGGDFTGGSQTTAEPSLTPAGGIVDPGTVTVTITCATSGAQIRYTTDGTDPDETTPTMVASGETVDITVAADEQVTLKARAFADGKDPSPIAVRTYIAADLRTPDSPDTVINGLAFSYYAGTCGALTCMDGTSPDSTGVLATPQPVGEQRNSAAGVVFSGYLSVASDGLYTLYIDAADSAEVYIGDTLVAAAGTLHGQDSGTIGLREGLHALRVRHAYSTTPSPTLQLQYTGPGMTTRQNVPAAQLYYDAPLSAAITVFSPNGGEQFSVGDSMTVRWISDCDRMNQVTVEISVNHEVSWDYLDMGLPCGQGELTVFIADSLQGTNCRIRVYEYNNLAVIDKSDGYFSIRAPSSLHDISPSTCRIDTLQDGRDIYVDRDYTFTEVGAYAGMLYIQTPNNDAEASADDYLSFTLGNDATVFVAYDQRATAVPDWLSSWEATGDSIRVSDGSMGFFRVYRKDFTAGEVVLGGNKAAGAQGAQGMYTVIVGHMSDVTQPRMRKGDAALAHTSALQVSTVGNRMRITVHTDQDHTLRVYRASGAVVHTFRGTHAATYRYTPPGSGIYFVRMETANINRSAAVMMMR